LNDLLNVDIIVQLRGNDLPYEYIIDIVGISDTDNPVYFVKEETMYMIEAGVGVYEIFKAEIELSEGELPTEIDDLIAFDDPLQALPMPAIIYVEFGRTFHVSALYTSTSSTIPDYLVSIDSLKELYFDNTYIVNGTDIYVHSNDIKETEGQILKIISSDESLERNFHLTTSIKGIGPVTACELIIKTVNFKKLPTAKKASSYAGICPFPNASGQMVRKSRVSPMSDKHLKSMLFMCAKSAVAHNQEYRLYYKKKELEGKPHYLIMTNVANKLLRTVYKVIETGIPWDPNYICLDPREHKNKVA
jgi:hypothetical protein